MQLVVGLARAWQWVLGRRWQSQGKTFVLIGDGGLQLGLSELCTAVEEQANLLMIVANSKSYEVIKTFRTRSMGDAEGTPIC